MAIIPGSKNFDVYKRADFGLRLTLKDSTSSAIDLTSASGDYDTQGNLQGYWKLNDGAGATAAVDSTGGTNGVLINDPIFA